MKLPNVAECAVSAARPGVSYQTKNAFDGVEGAFSI